MKASEIFVYFSSTSTRAWLNQAAVLFMYQINFYMRTIINLKHSKDFEYFSLTS